MLKTKFTFLLIAIVFELSAQRFSSQKSLVSFFSDAEIEDITAQNSKALGILDLSNSSVAFSIPITEFQFEKKLMRQHFNEKYMESEKYPKSTFQGKVIGFKPEKKGQQEVKAAGKLTIHGVSKEVELPGTKEMTDDKRIIIKSRFVVKLEDYKITIPRLLWKNLAEQVVVKVDFTLSQDSL